MSRNLHSILPPLVASCDLKVLDIVARDTTKALSYLLLKHSHEILAHIFLMEDLSQTENALQFLAGVLTKEKGDGMVDIVSVVRACLTPLLAEIVMVMGDDSADVAALVSEFVNQKPTPVHHFNTGTASFAKSDEVRAERREGDPEQLPWNIFARAYFIHQRNIARCPRDQVFGDETEDSSEHRLAGDSYWSPDWECCTTSESTMPLRTSANLQ